MLVRMVSHMTRLWMANQRNNNGELCLKHYKTLGKGSRQRVSIHNLNAESSWDSEKDSFTNRQANNAPSRFSTSRAVA